MVRAGRHYTCGGADGCQAKFDNKHGLARHWDRQLCPGPPNPDPPLPGPPKEVHGKED